HLACARVAGFSFAPRASLDFDVGPQAQIQTQQQRGSQSGNGLSSKAAVAPAARVQSLKRRPIGLCDWPVSTRRAIQGFVVHQHDYTIARELRIELDTVEAVSGSGAQTGQGVLR